MQAPAPAATSGARQLETFPIFGKLPLEVKCLIASKLDPIDILRLGMASHDMQKVAKHPTTWTQIARRLGVEVPTETPIPQIRQLVYRTFPQTEVKFYLTGRFVDIGKPGFLAFMPIEQLTLWQVGRHLAGDRWPDVEFSFQTEGANIHSSFDKTVRIRPQYAIAKASLAYPANPKDEKSSD